MAKNLIVVESPAKARTIVKYLGKDFQALASYGHVRDLRPKSGAIDPENDFEMHYEVIDRNRKHVDAIVRELKKADALYLATDPDREGEAISWHLYELLKERNVLDDKAVHRVEFYEFTSNAIRAAIDKPRTLSDNLINAQQARRALDYLVGFTLSPLLWKKVRRGLSAGRVQTPALRLIVEREEEIERFVKREYWTLEADLDASGQAFRARLSRLGDKKVEQFDITDEATASSTRERLLNEADGNLTVISVDRSERKRNPAPPFTTSTLQQEASRKLGFGAQRTMRIAQQLYEGIDIDGELVGLITYMRTDSVNLAGESIGEIRGFVTRRYGADSLPAQARAFRNKSKNAQEAHEAIRPTSVERTPERIGGGLSSDQRRLYELIWKRTLACQMIHATLETVAIDLEASKGDVFRATGSTIVNPGFLAVYEEGEDDRKEAADDGQPLLPALEAGNRVDLRDILARQHFTEPPPRYSEASLVKTLEAYGIGRPSTYASIIATLVQREYVELDNRRFRPTEVGRVVAKFLSEHFERYVDYEFTARLEDELDAVSRGEKEWIPLIRAFWEPFRDRIQEKEQSVSRSEARREREVGVDPASGKPVSVRMGRYGPFAQIGAAGDGEEKPRFASLRPGQNLDTIALEDVLKLFELPRDLGTTEDGEELAVNIGRFGPYVRYGSRFASLHKTDDPYTVTRERALEIVAEKKQRDAERFIKSFDDGAIQILKGRWGPYVTDGKRNARIPKETDPATLNREVCVEMLENAPVRGRGGAARKSAPAAANDDAPRKVAAKRTPARKKTTSRKKKTTKRTAKKVSKKATNSE